MDELKKQAEELGIKVDGRWSAERLQAEIDEKLAADPEPEPSLVDDLPDSGPEPVIEVPVTEREQVDETEAQADPVEPEPEPEPEPEVEDVESITITSLVQNPMRAFGLTGLGSSVVLTRAQLEDEAFVAKVVRAEEFGFIEARK